MTTRAEIATALSTVDGISGSEFRPSVLAAGNAWAQMGAWDFANAGYAYVRNWNIYVILPQDERGASIWLEANMQDILDALRPVIEVDRIEPVVVPADTSSLFAALITGRSE